MKRLFFISFLFSFCVIAQNRPFPTAEGPCENVTGGRGGIVIKVTNLNDTGVGSYRYALTNQPNTPRTIVFDVSGTLIPVSPIDYSGLSNFTIAGQTAPEGGFTIQAATVTLTRTENAIIRYLRIVNTSFFYDGGVRGTLNLSGSNNVIIDHCSMRYSHISLGFIAQDDNDTNNGQDNITIQRSIIADNHTGGIVGAITSSPRDALAGKNSVHHNLFVNVDHRFPNVAGDAKAEIVENVIYNYRARLSTFFNDSETNLINNTYKAGSASIFSAARHKIGEYIGETPRVYTSGNRIIDGTNTHLPTDTDWNGLFVIWTSSNDATEVTPTTEALYRANTPFANLGIPITQLGTDAAFTNVLNDVGANKYLNADGSYGTFLDENDTNYINDVTNGTCWSCQPDGSHPDKTDAAQLNYPSITSLTRPVDYDSDNDGIPNAYELSRGWDAFTANNNVITHSNGYTTQLEEFIYLVDTSTPPVAPSTPVGWLKRGLKMQIMD